MRRVLSPRNCYTYIFQPCMLVKYATLFFVFIKAISHSCVLQWLSQIRAGVKLGCVVCVMCNRMYFDCFCHQKVKGTNPQCPQCK